MSSIFDKFADITLNILQTKIHKLDYNLFQTQEDLDIETKYIRFIKLYTLITTNAELLSKFNTIVVDLFNDEYELYFGNKPYDDLLRISPLGSNMIKEGIGINLIYILISSAFKDIIDNLNCRNTDKLRYRISILTSKKYMDIKIYDIYKNFCNEYKKNLSKMYKLNLKKSLNILLEQDFISYEENEQIKIIYEL